MNASISPDVEFASVDRWAYAAPPTIYDLIRDHCVWRTVRSMVHVLYRAGLRWYNHLHVRGQGNVPRHRACIFAPNHSSHLDALAVCAALPTARASHTCAAAAEDYFFGQSVLRRLVRLLVNCIPLNRTGANLRGLRLCIRKLRQGDNLILFPEGQRSRDGTMAPFRHGVVALGRRLHVPVVPTYIQGAYESLDPAHSMPRPVDITVTFGDPLRFWAGPLARLPREPATRALEASVRALKDNLERTEPES